MTTRSDRSGPAQAGQVKATGPKQGSVLQALEHLTAPPATADARHEGPRQAPSAAFLPAPTPEPRDPNPSCVIDARMMQMLQQARAEHARRPQFRGLDVPPALPPPRSPAATRRPASDPAPTLVLATLTFCAMLFALLILARVASLP